jgi:hypothetical protein
MISAHNEAVNAFLQALGAPKHVREFELKIKVGEVVTARCEYYPEGFPVDEKGEPALLAREYELVEKRKPPQSDPACGHFGS